jgi:hypothetical protein
MAVRLGDAPAHQPSGKVPAGTTQPNSSAHISNSSARTAM